MGWRCWQLSSLAGLVGLACIDIGEIPVPPADADPARLGAACSTNEDCAGWTCVDRFCCAEKTCPTCQACSKKGQCVPVSAGDRDPSLFCDSLVEPLSSCGWSGACDGYGACAYHPQGTICDTGTCNGGVVVNAHTCDGRGQCVQGATIVCAPFSCASGRCLEGCASDADCLGRPCVSGSCGKRLNAARCKRDDECESGFCADGVCCNEACTGSCTSCNQRGSEGSCAYVAMGVVDPHGGCSWDPPKTCGFDSRCDGAGGCLLYKQGAVCEPAVCSTGGVSLRISRCDGRGTCGREISLCPTSTCDADQKTCR